MPYVPAKVMRTITRVAGAPMLSPHAPVWLQRKLTDQLEHILPAPKGTRVEEVTLGGVPARRVSFGNVRTDRAVLHLHGGAYIFGSSKSHTGMGAQLSRRMECPVYVLDYRLAPEHPWPGAEDDAYAAFTALVDGGLEPAGIAFTGDSAGGGLVVGVALRAVEASVAPPSSISMLCPWVDLSPVYPKVSRDPALTGAFLALSAARYLADTSPERPARDLTTADLTGLPPILLQASDDDPITPDAIRFAERARSFGVDVTEQTFTGVWHAFQAYAAILKDASDALDSVAAHARRAWAR